MEAAGEQRLGLRPGTESEIVKVLTGSKQVWGAGISLEDYVEYHRLIRHHPWSKNHFQHLVLADELGDIFSSCKIYYHQARVDSELFKLAGVGAVFTPAAFRGKGYAQQMLEHILDELRESGYDLVMLFSDIGPEYYTRLDFRLIRKYDPVYSFLNLPPPPPAVEVYEYLPEELLEWHLAFAPKSRFALTRTRDYFQLLSERIDWHRKYMGFREQRVLVAREDQSYLWVDLSRFRLIVRDFAAASDPPDQALSRLLAGLQARFNFREITGWLPPEFERYPCLKLREKHLRNKTILMMTALNEKARAIFSLPDDEIHFWLADYF